jgi:hypothetical protein
MGNPVEGQDHTVQMTVSDECDLNGATITIKYRKPNRAVVDGLAPTDVDIENKIISYRISSSISVNGKWLVRAKIVESDGGTYYTNPAAPVFFDRRLD